MVFLDRLGWPVETVKGRPVLNFLRLLIHTRKVVRRWEPPPQRVDVTVTACVQSDPIEFVGRRDTP